MSRAHADGPVPDRAVLRRWLALHAALAAGAVLLVHLAGAAFARGAGDIGAPELRAELEAARPDVLLLGNSMLKDGVNADLLDELLAGHDAEGAQEAPPMASAGARAAAPSVFKHALGGVYTAYWTLYLKNCAIPAGPPELVIIPFRDPILTFATFRTTGPYAENIARVSLPEEPEYAAVLARNTQATPGAGDRVLAALRDASPAYAARDRVRDGLFDLLKALPAEAARGGLPAYAEAVPAVLPVRAFAAAEDGGTAPGALDTGAPAGGPDAGNPFGALEGTPGSAVFTTLDYLRFDRVVEASFLPALVASCREHGVRLALLRLHKGPSPDWSDMVPADLLAAYERDCNAWLAAHDVILLDTTRDDAFTLDTFRGADHLNEAGRELLTIRLAHWLAHWWTAPDAPAAELARHFVEAQELPPAATVATRLREWEVPTAAVEPVRRAMHRVSLPPELAVDGDTADDPERSRWELFEDDRPLGPAHVAPPTIAKFGAGRYAHAGAELLFSASDDSSPRDNGRRYVLRKRVLTLDAKP